MIETLTHHSGVKHQANLVPQCPPTPYMMVQEICNSLAYTPHITTVHGFTKILQNVIATDFDIWTTNVKTVSEKYWPTT